MGCHPWYNKQKKNWNCRQPELNIASGQIYCIISYHQYIWRSRYAGEWENYRLKGNCKMYKTCSANVDKQKKTTATATKRKKKTNFVVSVNHSLRGACDGQNYLIVMVQKETRFLTLYLPWGTKREFLLTISLQYQADKWWE